MGAIWMGQEDIDFPNGIIFNVQTNASYYRAGYARCSLVVPVTGDVAKSLQFPGGAVTDFWVSCRLYYHFYGSSPTLYFLGVGKLGTPSGLWLGCSSSSIPRLSKYDGTTRTTLKDANQAYYSDSTLHKLDMHVVNFGATATVTCYVNGTDVFTNDTATEDVTTSDMSNVDCVLLSGIGSTWAQFSEVFVSTIDTRAKCLVGYYPDSANPGDTNEFTGGAGNIDEVTKDDGDLVYVNTNDKVCQVNLTPTPSGTFNVEAVQISARCMKSSDSTPTKVALGVHATGGGTDAGSDQSLTEAWSVYQRIMNTNPITSNPFTTAELDALQLQLKSRA